ncbi:MAG TPA: hypothetical protein VF411_05865 [Bacteroidia bacterium]
MLLLKQGEIPNDSLYIIGSKKDLNGKKVNMYASRFNYKLGEKVMVNNDNIPEKDAKIIELYDDEALVESFIPYSDGQTSSGYNSIKIIVPYNKISKKQK